MYVGKTCLTLRFCGEKFQEEALSTIGFDFRVKTVEVDGEPVELQLWDTAGQERFRHGLVQQFYHNVHGVIFVYDVTQQSSFNSLSKWIQECNEHNVAQSIPCILIGNKCDIVRKLGISTPIAQQFADRHRMPLFTTSAKDDRNVDHVEAIFLTLVDKLMNNKPVTPSTIIGFRYESGQDRVFTIEAERCSLSRSNSTGHSCAAC